MSGLELRAVDSDTIGDKYTHCSWGMCSEDLEQWPDVEDHLFPEEFPERISPKYLGPGQKCPMDRRTGGEGWGCFYSCRVFQDGLKDRAVALKLYDEELEKVK
jgi:hypothetical protein